MNAYCLFCETAECRYAAPAAAAMFGCTAIIPKQVQHTWKDGGMTDRIRDLLPGYLFLYSDDPVDVWRSRQIPGVLRCLRTSDFGYELSGDDKAFALFLLEKDGIVGKTGVYQENDRISLTEGAFAGLRTKILKVDRRASRMQIEIPFARRIVKTWVEYEIISPEDKETIRFREEQKENPDGNKKPAD